jgi:AhpD family alkylhydroperoxidase
MDEGRQYRMKLDYRIRELIAVGSSVGANCHSCLEYHFGKAREQGIPDDEIAEAIEVGKMVRKGAQGKMDKLATNLLRATVDSAVGRSAGCDCDG